MIWVYHTKLNGVWYAAAVQDDQLFATCFSIGEPELMRLLRRLPDGIPFLIAKEPNPLLTNIMGALEDIFNGKYRESHKFKIAIDHLSSYKRKVLNCTSLVPVGYVTSYGSLAEVVGGSARSVGRVEASNPFPLLIPCHRVVCSDFSIGGYGYGKAIKLEILQREERGYEKSRKLEVEGGEISLIPVGWIKQNRESF